MKDLIKYLMMLAIVLAVSLPTMAETKRDSVQETYLSEIGVREATGQNDGEAVEKYLASCHLDKGYAWCAAFVNWSLTEHDVQTPKSPAWSPSWFTDNTIIDKDNAQYGDVFGIYFKSKKRIAHVGFIDEWEADKDYCYAVEGNTNNAGSREGDGVYRKRRLKRQIYKVADWIANTKTKQDDKTLANVGDVVPWNGYRSKQRHLVLL